ncbi:NitT/TauT family transport system substrate-binding protein [Paucidesulfovibrio gracilis DSM 16080]|uniref:Thiamine pyrimidine synthase n=1 Tax=Paucidesulfovibrio gracilis DSM 16080 TaxID=1121449 RepID=A0A1T4WXB5_9BACT|nr:ABC transporter substrate-binding protein [Paucidesulfovibrio gracilis]SKA81966.1 NitT/TauT family transport system substrate-binding protein [Paucidesulfovibrio gracilis DSM 16080]
MQGRPHGTASVWMVPAWLLILTAAVCLSYVPARAGQKRLERVSLMLQWSPQAQFAGFYMAEKKGMYEQRGLDMRLIPGGPDRVASDWLDSRDTDFCTMFLSTALERWDSGMPLVNVGQFVRHSALMLVARRGQGIRTAADLHGRKVSMWANEFQIQPRALFRSLGVRPEIVPLGSSMDLFLRGAVHATTVMWYNEYHTLLSAGLREEELQPIFFRDTEYDFPEDGVYCLRSTAEQRPEVALAVVDATREGWEYAFAHEEETLDVIVEHMREAGLPVTRVHQRWMLRRMRDVILPKGETRVDPSLNPATFRRVAGQLLEAGVIRRLPQYEHFYKGPDHAR